MLGKPRPMGLQPWGNCTPTCSAAASHTHSSERHDKSQKRCAVLTSTLHSGHITPQHGFTSKCTHTGTIGATQTHTGQHACTCRQVANFCRGFMVLISTLHSRNITACCMHPTAVTPTAAHRAQQSIAGSYDTVVSYEPAIGAT